MTAAQTAVAVAVCINAVLLMFHGREIERLWVAVDFEQQERHRLAAEIDVLRRASAGQVLAAHRRGYTAPAPNPAVDPLATTPQAGTELRRLAAKFGNRRANGEQGGAQ